MRKPLLFKAALLAVGCASPVAAGGFSEEQIERGRFLFHEEHYCVACHGEDATGDVNAGGVFIQGALLSSIQMALTGVQEMKYLEVPMEDMEALEAYLDHLM